MQECVIHRRLPRDTGAKPTQVLAIRMRTSVSPVLFVIGLPYTGAADVSVGSVLIFLRSSGPS